MISRQVAFKVSVRDIINGEYVKQEGWNPNFIADIFNREISRVNIVGVVLSKTEDLNFNSIMIDDGSGRISVRSFDETNPFKELDVGDVVLIIGRPRVFNNNKYIVAEIVRKINNKNALKLRSLELELEKKKILLRKKKSKTRTELIYELIKKLDSGDGVNVNDLVEKARESGVVNVDETLKRLLENGDIFEVRPGVYKTIE